jgi:hypothetical protein
LEIEKAILAENAAKFQQSFNTPFYTEPLSTDFGYKALTSSATQVLLGIYTPPPHIDDATKCYLQKLELPNPLKTINRKKYADAYAISVKEHISFWKRAKETTSCYPCELSFATMKAGASDSTIATVDCLAANIPLKGGFSPDSWQHATDVMIPKKSGVTLLSALRTIVLFPVDCNYVFKFIGKQMMQQAEALGALAPEQYGSRKHHKAIDLAACKTITYDIIRQLKRPGAICCNDAKSCYDLIGHSQASLSMQRVGVPRSAIDCMFSTLQQAKHYVRTSFGDSTGYYIGSSFRKPLHGIGQGNGSGPGIWAVVSSPVLNLMREKGYGAEFICPLSKVKTDFGGYTFVDDTDLVVVKLSFKDFADAAHSLQGAMTTWEKGIRATSGAIVPEKTYVYIMDFAWKSGLWTYHSCATSPASFEVRDITGILRPVKRYEVWEAQETLGVYLAPDGNTAAQFDKMLDKAVKWADNMRTGRISKNEVWLAFSSTIWRTLCYPLPALNLTKKQCELIMTPLLKYLLPALGICRTFPRDLVFAPIKYMGLGVKHLYTVQEIGRIKEIISQSMQHNLLTSLYGISLSCLIIEIGLIAPLHTISYDTFGHLATPSLIKSTWEFLHKHDIEMRHDLTIKPPRHDDIPIMKLFIPEHPSREQLAILNRCRLFLRAFWISDIVDGAGIFLSDEAWLGHHMHNHREQSWPRQGKPTPADWLLWRHFLTRSVLRRGRRTIYSLGQWTTDSDNLWHNSVNDDALYHVSPSGCLRFPRAPRSSGRPRFLQSGSTSIPPPNLHKATVY